MKSSYSITSVFVLSHGNDKSAFSKKTPRRGPFSKKMPFACERKPETEKKCPFEKMSEYLWRDLRVLSVYCKGAF